MSNPTDVAEIEPADEPTTSVTTQRTPIGVHISTALLEIGFLVCEFQIGHIVISHFKSLLISF